VIAGMVRLDGSYVSEADLKFVESCLNGRLGAKSVTHAGGAIFGALGRDTVAPSPFTKPDLEEPPDSHLVLVTDARLIDRRPLERLLGLPPESHSWPDSRVMLEAFRSWDVGFASRLNGDFSGVIWDAARRRAILVRDRMGVRPLYYYVSSQRLIFASQLTCLRSNPAISSDVSARMIAGFMDYSYAQQRESTFFSAIRRVPAAHVLELTTGRLELTHYWDFTPREWLGAGSESDVTETFRTLLEMSVRNAIEGEDRIGTTLSGGLDSTTIACIANRVREKTSLAPISVIYPGLPPELNGVDEQDYIREVNLTECEPLMAIRGDLYSPVAMLRDHIRLVGQPHHGMGLFVNALVYEQAAVSGLSTVLVGTDGDTVVSHGRERLAHELQRGHWEAFVRETRAAAQRWGVGEGLIADNYLQQFFATLRSRGRWWTLARGIEFAVREYSQSRTTLYWHHFVQPFCPWPSKRERLAKRDEAFWASFLSPEFRRRAESEGYSSATPELALDPWTRHFRALTNGVWQTELEVNSAVAEHWGIDVRFPFFDRRLIELCVDLPLHFKMSDGWGRYVLRTATRDLIPDRIRWRTTKAELNAYFLYALATFDRESLRESLASGTERLSEFFNMPMLMAALDTFLSAPLTHQWLGLAAYRALVIHEWLRTLEE